MTPPDRLKRGKTELVILCTIALSGSLFIIAMYNYNIGHDKLLFQILRILLSIFLMLLTIDGNKVGKWLLLFTFIYSTLEFAKNFRFILLNHWFTWIFVFIGIYNVFFIIYLLASKNINLYLNDKYIQNENSNKQNIN